MSAIITTKFRYQTAANLINALGGNGTQGAESYYVFIGRTFAWPVSDSNPTVPQDRFLDENDAKQNIVALKKVSSTYVSNVAPRYNWISGTTYAEYDDEDFALNSKQYYVLTDDLNVYKCIKAGGGASVIKPTGTSPQMSAIGADGYQWKYMYTLTGADVNKFLTSAFFSAKKLTVDDSSLQWPVQQAAVDGAIYRIRVTSGGSGYQSKPTVTIVGNGTGCTVLPAGITLVNGVVTEILIDPTLCGTGYRFAKVVISGGNPTTPATARAVISPIGGHGSDPIKELPAYYVMIDSQLAADEGSGDFIIDNDFRQIGIMRNPIDTGTGLIGQQLTYSALTTLTHQAVTGAAFTKDAQVIGQTSGAIAFIDSIESTTKIKIHQNTTTGFTPFVAGETIQVGTSTAVLSTIQTPEVNVNTGEVVYIENLTPVNRNISQTEDIKLVLEL